MALVRPSGPSHEPSTIANTPSANDTSTNNADNAEQLVLVEKPVKEWLHQLRPPRREIYVISAKLVLVLIFAISYLTFCFIVHYRNIPLGRSRVLGLPFLHFGTVSAITTMSILIVYVALWPMMGLIDEIRAEEFFRLMDTHPKGVPLDRVNAVSATTTGAFDILMAAIHRHCSPLLMSTLVISLAITATSSIAPAALSAGSIFIDVDNSTIPVGALPKDSVLVNHGTYNGSKFNDLLPLASTMAWVENTLNFTNGYYKVTGGEDDQFEYLVPFPPEYTSTMKAHWTTDVIVLDPSCSWQTATTAGFVNSSWDVTLPESNLGISLASYHFVSSDFNITQVSVFMGSNKSAAEFTVPVDGSVLFVIDQLNYPESYGAKTISVDLSSIPTLKFPTGHVLAFLLCSPHVSIQTHRVRATGNGNLTLGKPQQSQGNIDFYQANFLLSHILLALPTNSGPTTSPFQVGTDLMVRLLFGTDVAALAGYLPPAPYLLPAPYLPPGPYLPPTPYMPLGPYMPPAPLTNITAVYKQIIHSAMKTVLSGAIDRETVPGGYIEEQMVFTSSLGHVITSTILFAFLTIALVAAQFRKGRVAFTLVDVAAALAGSDVPRKSVEMMQFKAGTAEKKVLKFVPIGDGRFNCVYESVGED